MKVRVAAATDVGLVRERNEDSYSVEDPFFAVADGLGGHQGGEVASGLALETLSQATSQEVDEERVPESLVAGVRRANDAVHARAAERAELKGMGTTLTALVAGGGRFYMAHVGDSRAYLLRDGELRQVTEDHTLVRRLVEEGRLSPEEAQIHPQRSVLTRALGIDEDLEVDQATIEAAAGDRFLLCSDGLSSMIDDGEIQAILEREEDPQAASDALVSAAKDAGGHDNVTVVVLDVLAADPVPAAIPADAEERRERPAAAAPVPPEKGFAAAPPKRRWRRRLAWVVVVLAVLGALGFGARAYVRQQWYVGEHEGHVALYRGMPVTILGLDLSTLVEETALPAEDASQLQPWAGLEDGITSGSEEEARSIIADIERDLAT